MKHIAAIIAFVALCAVTASAQFVSTSTGTFDAAWASSGSYTSFSWKWMGSDDQSINVKLLPSGSTAVTFRLCKEKRGTIYLDCTGGTLSNGTNYTLTIDQTSMPPDNVYFAEFLGVSNGTARSLATGKVNLQHSLYQNDSSGTWTNPLVGTQIGPPWNTLTDSSNWPFVATSAVDGVTLVWSNGVLSSTAAAAPDLIARANNVLTSNSIAPAIEAATGTVATALRGYADAAVEAGTGTVATALRGELSIVAGSAVTNIAVGGTNYTPSGGTVTLPAIAGPAGAIGPQGPQGPAGQDFVGGGAITGVLFYQVCYDTNILVVVHGGGFDEECPDVAGTYTWDGGNSRWNGPDGYVLYYDEAAGWTISTGTPYTWHHHGATPVDDPFLSMPYDENDGEPTATWGFKTNVVFDSFGRVGIDLDLNGHSLLNISVDSITFMDGTHLSSSSGVVRVSGAVAVTESSITNYFSSYIEGFNLAGLSENGTTTITRAMGQSLYLVLTNAQTFTVDSSFPAYGDSCFSLSLTGNYAVTFYSGTMTNTLSTGTTPSYTNAWGTVIFHRGYGQTRFVGR